MFDRLHEPGAQLLVRQRFEKSWVNHDKLRLFETADEVLPLGKIDAGLASDAGIDHGEESCRYLCEANAPHERCGDEAGDVPDHSAAEAENEARAIQPLPQKRVVEVPRRVEGLVAFPVRDQTETRAEAGDSQCCGDGLPVDPMDHRVGNNGHASPFR